MRGTIMELARQGERHGGTRLRRQRGDLHPHLLTQPTVHLLQGNDDIYLHPERPTQPTINLHQRS
jgi:hypothetical protein